MNSAIGSVVPLAIFLLQVIAEDDDYWALRLHTVYTGITDILLFQGDLANIELEENFF